MGRHLTFIDVRPYAKTFGRVLSFGLTVAWLAGDLDLEM
jgi:hypothetical protein